MKNIYVVIMAGGSGERFWPSSRKKCPKQLLPIVSKNSMLQETVNRLKGFADNKNIIIVTNKVQAKAVRKQLPQLPKKNIVVEPFSKNTAPCIGVAADIIGRENPNAVMVVLPADHQIKDAKKFLNTLNQAVRVASEKEALVTLGIKPRFPHTGYGYIKKGEAVAKGFFKIAKFAEKPDIEKAKEYCDSGEYYWNSGMFIWKASVILGEIENYMSSLSKLLKCRNLYKIYKDAENISIDYGIMEKTKKAVVMEAEFPWDDVGSWTAVDAHKEKDLDGNVMEGQVISKDVKNSTVIAKKNLVGIVGLSDIIVIAEKDAILVCPKNRAEDVKHIVGLLKKEEKYKRYL